MLAVAAAAVLLAQSPAWPSRLTLSATIPADEPPAPGLRFALSSPGRAEAPVVPVLLPCSERVCQSELELTPGSWILRSEEGDRFWVEPTAVVLGSESQRLLLEPVLPKRRLAGSISLPAEGAPESGLRVRFRLAQSPALDFNGESACLLAASAWSCEVPAAVLDLRFEIRGHVPIHRWSADLRPGQDPGGLRLAFERGAALAGWVEGSFDEGARLDATVIPLADGSLAAAAPPAARTATVRPVGRAGGYFAFGPLAPGSFEVQIAVAGQTAARLRPVIVDEERAEIVRVPVRLDRGAGLDVRVSPPTTGAGGPWKLRLLFLDPAQELVEEVGVWELRGELRISGLVAGEYRVTLFDERGDRFGDRAVTLAAAVEPLSFELAVGVSISGRVRLGEEPLAETALHFRREGKEIRLRTDGAGLFSGAVPEAGAWRVKVRSRSPNVDRTLKVEIDAPPGGKAEVDLLLPDRRISGRVVGVDGRPARAGVYYFLEGDTGGEIGAAAANTRGEFEHRGLDEGRYVVWAETGETEASDQVTVDLSGGTSHREIELRLKSKRRLMGLVMAGGGPVAGARLELVSLVGPFHSEVHSAVSGPDGRFEVSVAAGQFPLVVTAEAGGWPLAVARAESAESELTVVIPGEAGELVVRDLAPVLPGAQGDPYSGLLLVRDGLPIALWQHAALGALRLAATPDGALAGRLRLAPGPVVVCGGTVPELSAVLAGADSTARCSQGTVPAFGQLVLEIR
jgi:hypothetical protein